MMQKLSFFILFLFLYAPSHASPIFPRQTGQIVDSANILSQSEKNILRTKVQKLEEQSSDQLVIVTLPSLQGYDIAEFSVELARHWKIGQKEANNGVLLVIAPKERKMRIEVGYGLEGTLPDALANNILQNSIKPYFKKGQMFKGILKGTEDIISVLLGNKDEVKQRLKHKKQPTTRFFELLPFALFFLFGSAPILSSWLSKFGWFQGGGVIIIPGSPTSAPSIGNHHGGWYGGSGGWSGGSSGGWSGGGGSFGGGGSSGGW